MTNDSGLSGKRDADASERRDAGARRRLSVLLYHEIGPRPRPSANLDCFCALGAFRDQMRFLKEHAVRVLSARDACENLGGSENTDAVVLTFDDGDSSFLEYALPVLDELELPATVFAVAGRLGTQAHWVKDPRNAIPLMTAQQLRSLGAHRVEIGSHTMTHRKLTELSLSDAASELRESKAFLEQVLERPVTSLAYPHGRYDATIIDLVETAGYQYAYTTDGERISAGHEDRFRLPRKYITFHDDLNTFAHKLGFMNSGATFQTRTM